MRRTVDGIRSGLEHEPCVTLRGGMLRKRIMARAAYLFQALCEETDDSHIATAW